VQGERFNHIARNRQLTRLGALVVRNASRPVDFFEVFVRRFLFADVAFAHRPVDEHHTDDDRTENSGGRSGKGKVLPRAPAEIVEDRPESARCSVSALKADRQAGAEEFVQMEDRAEQKKDKSDADDVLSPRNDLSVSKLAACTFPNLGKTGDLDTEEETGKNYIDQNAGHLTPAERPGFR